MDIQQLLKPLSVQSFSIIVSSIWVCGITTEFSSLKTLDIIGLKSNRIPMMEKLIPNMLAFFLKINSSTRLQQYSQWPAAVPASAVFYLNAFDTVYVSMTGNGKLAAGASFNDIQIEKIN